MYILKEDFKMASKGYDIVETSKMAMEYDGSLINVECVADGALENGRLVAIDGTSGKVRYATPSDAIVFLHASVEKMYDTTLGLGDFRAEDGDYVRILRMRAGDQFATTAFNGTVAKGDLVMVDDSVGHVAEFVVNGTDIATALHTFKVIDATYKLGFGASSLGFTAQPALILEVIK
jgi:hypothetical protein